MAAHSSILAWKTPEEPGRLQSMGSQKSQHGFATKQQQQSISSSQSCHFMLEATFHHLFVRTPFCLLLQFFHRYFPFEDKICSL